MVKNFIILIWNKSIEIKLVLQKIKENYFTLNPQVSVVMSSQIAKNQALRRMKHSIAMVNEA